MKKVLWISAAAAALMFAGCSDQTKEDVKKAAQSVGNDAAKATETAKAKAGEAMEEAKRRAAEAVDSVKERARELKKSAGEKAVEAAEAVERKAGEIKKELQDSVGDSSAPKGAALYAKCAGCHGADGKTRALGKSATIAGQSAGELREKLAAYKAGTRNINGMGTLMTGQVSALDDAEIGALAEYIAAMK